MPLFLLAAAVGMLLPPTIGMLGFALAPGPSVPLLPTTWLRWWYNVLAGVLLVAPVLLAAPRPAFARVRVPPLGAALYGLALLVLAAGIILPTLPTPRPPLFVISLGLIVVASMRFGLAAAAAGALALACVAGYSFAFRHGLFRDYGELDGLVALWSYSSALTLVNLLVTALLAQRDLAAARQLRAEQRYAQVFEANPQPLWVHDRESLQFLLVNRATARQYGWTRAQLLTRNVAELAVPGAPQAVPPPQLAPQSAAEPYETRHRTADGRMLEVELWTRPVDFEGRAAPLVFAADVTERKALGRALIEAIAGEKRRVGQEMHDGLGQELTGLALTVRALQIRAAREKLALAADLERVIAIVNGGIRPSRQIVQGLSPLSDTDGNLAAALTALAEASSVGEIEVRVRAALDTPLTLPIEGRNHLFRIAQEALQNAYKHSAAHHVELALEAQGERVRLSIVDDGRGLSEGAATEPGIGMRTMRYRAASIGGWLHIGPRPEGGTEVVCEAPQPPAEATALSA